MTRVVDVIDVYSSQPEVLPTLGNAVAEKPRSETMAAADDLIGTENLLVDELASNVTLVVLSTRWRRSIQRDISAFGADYELVSRCHAGRQHLLDRRADGALGTLA